MTSLFRRDCVCQSSALHEHTMVIYIDSTAAYNTHGQFIKTGPWLGLQTCMCNRRRISAPVSMDRACVGWNGPYIKKRLLVTLHALCAFCGKSIYTGKRNFFFFFFFFVKWSKTSHCPFYSPHSGVLFPSISYKMKHPFNKYMATHRLSPGGEQQANLARTKQQLRLIKA